MPQLPNRLEPFTDESLESYLLRLSQANFFESFSGLAVELRYWLQVHHSDLSGGFPIILDGINIYHAQQDSGRRAQSLFLLEQMTGLKQFSLLNIAFKHGETSDLYQRATVRYKDQLIPRNLLRSDAIPICPKCLSEQAYIRYIWHLEPVTACPDHHCKLVERCPQCSGLINYLQSELISHCQCGYNLTECTSDIAGDESYWLVQQGAFDAFGPCNLSQKLAVLSLGKALFPQKTQRDILTNWFALVDSLFEQQLVKQLSLAVRPAHDMTFKEVTDYFLEPFIVTSSLPDSVVSAVIFLILDKGLDENRTGAGDLGLCLVSVQEAAFLLRSTTNDVYRLYEMGVLNSTVRLPADSPLRSYKAVFRLRDVAGLALSCSSVTCYTSSR